MKRARCAWMELEAVMSKVSHASRSDLRTSESANRRTPNFPHMLSTCLARRAGRSSAAINGPSTGRFPWIRQHYEHVSTPSLAQLFQRGVGIALALQSLLSIFATAETNPGFNLDAPQLRKARPFRWNSRCDYWSSRCGL